MATSFAVCITLGVLEKFVDKSEVSIDVLISEIKAKEARRKAEMIRTASVTLAACFIGLGASVTQMTNLFAGKAKGPDTALADTSAMRSQIQSIDTRLARLDDLSKTLSVPGPETSIEQKKLAVQTAALDERLKIIEGAVIESPERALSIPLLRKDIAESMKRVEEIRAANRSEIDRLYEQQRWILGGIGTFLLAGIGGLSTIILRSLKKSKGEDA